VILKNRSQRAFVLTPVDLLRDKSFCSLSPRAQILWVHLRGQYNPYDPDCTNKATDEPQVRLAFSEAKKINGFAPRQFHNAINELINAGFLVISEKGGAKMGGASNAYSFKGNFKDFPKNQKDNQGKK